MALVLRIHNHNFFSEFGAAETDEVPVALATVAFPTISILWLVLRANT